MNTLSTASFYYCKCQEQIVTVRNWPCALHRKGSAGFGGLQTVQCEDKEPQVWMHIIPLLKPPNTHKHKKADVSSWISPWPSESICGQWDHPSLVPGNLLPFQSICLITLDVLHIPWHRLLLQSPQCQSQRDSVPKPFFFKTRKHFESGGHVPWFPNPLHAAQYRWKRRKILTEPERIRHNSMTSWPHGSLKHLAPKADAGEMVTPAFRSTLLLNRMNKG